MQELRGLRLSMDCAADKYTPLFSQIMRETRVPAVSDACHYGWKCKDRLVITITQNDPYNLDCGRKCKDRLVITAVKTKPSLCYLFRPEGSRPSGWRTFMFFSRSPSE